MPEVTYHAGHAPDCPRLEGGTCDCKPRTVTYQVELTARERDYVLDALETLRNDAALVDMSAEYVAEIDALIARLA